MRAQRIAVALCLAALACSAPLLSQAADPIPAPAGAPPAAANGSIAVTGPASAMTLTLPMLAALPSVELSVPTGPTPGTRARTYQGPLLWTVLVHAGATDPAKHQSDVRGTVVLTGQDGYTATLALGELSPEFEGKQVILALGIDGQLLEPGHLRIVVPGDKRGGRGVHDLVGISLAVGAPPQRPGR